MNDQIARFQAAADEYVARTKTKADVLGIVVSGSFAHAQIDPHSDIDIFVITDPSSTERERGNTWINGVEIEYFKNPPQQVRSYFRKEKSPHTAHILANGKVVFSRSTEVEKLIKEAKAILATPLTVLKPFQIELLKYHLDDLLKDQADCIHNADRFAGELIKFQIINRCIDTFCQVKRVNRTKDKRLESQLAEIDAGFAHAIKRLTLAEWNDANALAEVAAKMEEILGGKRTDEWVLRSSLDI
ncbi:MAG: nucleotidyltransferase domain-containing protein [Bacteroidia bacterium]